MTGLILKHSGIDGLRAIDYNNSKQGLGRYFDRLEGILSHGSANSSDGQTTFLVESR